MRLAPSISIHRNITRLRALMYDEDFISAAAARRNFFMVSKLTGKRSSTLLSKGMDE
ncbi:hypothetical protein D3C80_2029980 [compost metagenome]